MKYVYCVGDGEYDDARVRFAFTTEEARTAWIAEQWKAAPPTFRKSRNPDGYWFTAPDRGWGVRLFPSKQEAEEHIAKAIWGDPNPAYIGYWLQDVEILA